MFKTDFIFIQNLCALKCVYLCIFMLYLSKTGKNIIVSEIIINRVLVNPVQQSYPRGDVSLSSQGTICTVIQT